MLAAATLSLTFIQLLGWSGQSLYFLRTTGQWWQSEKSGRSTVPDLYWPISLAAAVLLLSYALLRQDSVIATGQALNLLIFTRNLFLSKNPDPASARRKKGVLLFLTILLLPALFLLVKQAQIHSWILLMGWIGQLIFLLRFPLQLWHAEKHGKAELPRQFWIVSLTGSLLLASYAALNHDPVILCGQSIGLLCYSRNLYLLHKEGRKA